MLTTQTPLYFSGTSSGGTPTPSPSPSEPTPSPTAGCDHHSSCSSCTTAAGCGWCSSDNACVPGDSNEAAGSSSSCAYGSGGWDWASCPTPPPSNQFSVSTQLQFSASFADMNNARWVHSIESISAAAMAAVAGVGPEDVQTLPFGIPVPQPANTSCSPYTSCNECVSSSNCGFCSVDNVCVAGNSNEASASSSESSCAYGKGGYQFASCDTSATAAPPQENSCSDLDDCSSCTAAAGCGWCLQDGACVPGDASHADSSGSCSDGSGWQYTTCSAYNVTFNIKVSGSVKAERAFNALSDMGLSHLVADITATAALLNQTAPVLHATWMSAVSAGAAPSSGSSSSKYSLTFLLIAAGGVLVVGCIVGGCIVRFCCRRKQTRDVLLVNNYEPARRNPVAAQPTEQEQLEWAMRDRNAALTAPAYQLMPPPPPPPPSRPPPTNPRSNLPPPPVPTVPPRSR